LKVEGKQLKTAQGTVVRLQGVNIPSLEWSQGEHLFQSLAAASDDWGVNVIRLPLSQDRWFGHTKEKQDGGVYYRNTVREFVRQAADKRCYVILDLHWSNAGKWGENIGQHQMPDDNSATFWSDVAAAYANDPVVLFGLYNEPHHVTWQVWRDGGNVVEKNTRAPGGKLEYHSPGLQKLLEVCRAQGAKNIVLAGGLDWGYDLSGVAKGFALSDPKGNGVLYDSHIYPVKKNRDTSVTAVADKYAVLVGEFGPDRSDPKAFANQILQYVDQHHLHWTAWCMHPGARPCLIKDWKYTPSPFGEPVKEALRAAAAKRTTPPGRCNHQVMPAAGVKSCLDALPGGLPRFAWYALGA